MGQWVYLPGGRSARILGGVTDARRGSSARQVAPSLMSQIWTRYSPVRSEDHDGFADANAHSKSTAKNASSCRQSNGPTLTTDAPSVSIAQPSICALSSQKPVGWNFDEMLLAAAGDVEGFVCRRAGLRRSLKSKRLLPCNTRIDFALFEGTPSHRQCRADVCRRCRTLDYLLQFFRNTEYVTHLVSHSRHDLRGCGRSLPEHVLGYQDRSQVLDKQRN